MEAAVAFGKYRILGRIAAGGMAEIFKAAYESEGVRKICVLKRVHPRLAEDEEFQKMFREEAALTMRLSHANVVPVFDFGIVDGQPFLAMEYVRGPSLRAVLNRLRETRERLPVRLALYITTEIAKGLAHAHSRRDDDGKPLNIVHRDVNPSNVLLSWEGEVKLTDFGIARAASRASHTAEGLVRGKASYLAPEQAEGREIDSRADLFALGAVLWELVAGRKLFEGDSQSETMARIVTAPIPPMSSVFPDVPKPVDQLAARMLERDRDARIADATAVERASSAVLASMGGATSAHLAAFLAPRFKVEIDSENEATATEAKILRAAPVPHESTSLSPSTHEPTNLGPGFWSDEHESKVDRLDDDARRRMFDFPPEAPVPPPIVPPAIPAAIPAASAPAPEAPHFLELDTSRMKGTGAELSLPIVSRVRAGGITLHVIRLAGVGAAAMIAMLIAVRIVYRH